MSIQESTRCTLPLWVFEWELHGVLGVQAAPRAGGTERARFGVPVMSLSDPVWVYCPTPKTGQLSKQDSHWRGLGNNLKYLSAVVHYL